MLLRVQGGQEVRVLSVVFFWWLALALASWLSWPLLAGVLRSLPDRGYAFARVFGLLLWAYLYWAMGHLGLPLGNPLAWWSVAALVALLGLWGWARRQRDLVATIQAEGRHMLAVELLFALFFALGVAYKAYAPAISQAEQPIGLAFLSSILNNPTVPPGDPWMAGLPIVYPYWGYLLAALPARAAGASAPVAYNVALAQSLALTALAGYGLIYNLLRLSAQWRERAARRIGALGGAIVALAGNWEAFFEYMRARGVGSQAFFAWLDIPGLAQAPTTGGHLPYGGDWWLRAGRVISDHTLGGGMAAIPTEFPVFGLLLGELAPHYMALPFLALALAVTLEIVESAGSSLTRWWRRPQFWAMAWIIGALGPLDPWCVPTALALALASWLLGDARGRADAHRTHVVRAQGARAHWVRWLANALGAIAALAGGAALLYLPFYLASFGRPGSPEIALDANTPIHHYLIVLGPWVIPLVGDALLAYEQMRQGARPLRRMTLLWLAIGLLLLALLGAWIIGGWAQAALKLALAVMGGPWVLLLQIGVLAILLASVARSYITDPIGQDRGRALSRLLLLAGVGLTLAAEFYYLGRGQGTRADTALRLYYQAWLLLGIGAICALVRLWQGGGRWRSLAALGLLLMAIGLYYPAAATYTKTAAFQGEPTLDGAAYLQIESPGAYAVYRWLADNARPGEVLAEGPGLSLDASTSRMATLTGMPAVLGWAGHEARWRGQEAVAQRLDDLDTIYRSRDESEVLAALARYGVTYLYISPAEIELYRITDTKLIWHGTFLRPVLLVDGHQLYRAP